MHACADTIADAYWVFSPPSRIWLRRGNPGRNNTDESRVGRKGYPARHLAWMYRIVEERTPSLEGFLENTPHSAEQVIRLFSSVSCRGHSLAVFKINSLPFDAGARSTGNRRALSLYLVQHQNPWQHCCGETQCRPQQLARDRSGAPQQLVGFAGRER
jgi:hypothetical protein